MLKNHVSALFLCLVIGAVLFMWKFPVYLSKKHKFHHIWNDTHETIDLWLIFTKAASNGDLVTNFRKLVQSLCAHSTKHLQFNIIAEKSSTTIANNVFNMKNICNCTFNVSYYDKDDCIKQIHDIVEIMTPHFSSLPGAYYSDPFYYISLGLHRIAPQNQNEVILIDCDMVFVEDVYLLFAEFKKFSNANLFGLAHELSSVYRHVLNTFRINNNETYLGEPVSGKNNFPIESSVNGFPGFNSGVVLLNLERIRQSSVYQKLLSNETVMQLTEKYSFKGSLGDQDYYTLLYFDHPELFHILHCGWNRQLCKWWKKTEEDSIFNEYFKCSDPIYVFHKNCHTSLPVS